MCHCCAIQSCVCGCVRLCHRRYEYEPLMNAALDLLVSYYTKRQTFIDAVQRVQLLVDESKEALLSLVCVSVREFTCLCIIVGARACVCVCVCVCACM